MNLPTGRLRSEVLVIGVVRSPSNTSETANSGFSNPFGPTPEVPRLQGA